MNKVRHWNLNRILGLIILIGAIYLYLVTMQWKTIDMRILPHLILIVLGLLSLILVITGGSSKKQSKDTSEEANYPRLFIVIITTLFYILGIEFLGFFVSTFLYLVGMYLYVYLIIIQRKTLIIITIPLVMLLFLFLVFTLWLRVPVPDGIFF